MKSQWRDQIRKISCEIAVNDSFSNDYINCGHKVMDYITVNITYLAKSFFYEELELAANVAWTV